jgi:antitoxin component YwqK of YwqJK toxin-antitoxin module
MNFNALLEILNEMSEIGSNAYTLNWGNGTVGINVVFKTGTKVLHNESGPAVELFYKNGKPKLISYYRDGALHNLKGPALEEYNQDGSLIEKKYYIKGKEVLPNEVSQAAKNYTDEDLDILNDLNS